MGTPTFEGLIDLLWRHPEFNSLESNECDAEIICYGKKLWKMWVAQEKEMEDEFLDHPVVRKPRKSKLSQKTQSILNMIEAGRTNVEIRSMFGLTAQQLADIRYRHGVTRKRNGDHNYSSSKYNFDVATVEKDIKELRSIAKVAKKYQVYPEALRRFMRANIISYPNKKTRSIPIIPVKKIQQAAVKQGTLTKAAKHLGVSPATLRNMLLRQGTSWKEISNAA
ncbi:hypothetical protein [Enterococcus sp.]|uniref:hypothetical protein n=1 Tax=Enterococcus sp. TaxID=35783 RepID=UPI002FC619AC